MTNTVENPTAARAHRHGAFHLGLFSSKSRKLKQEQREQSAPKRYPFNHRYLDEFKVLKGYEEPSEKKPEPEAMGRKPSMGVFKKPIEIQSTTFIGFISDGVALYISNLLHPSMIPGRDMLSRMYAMLVLPILIIAMAIVQWGIGLLVILVNNTRIGAHYYGIFFNDQIALFDETDFVDPEGNDEALRQLASRRPRPKTHFSYHIANLLLIMSSMVYSRDEKKVAQASKMLLDIRSQAERDEASKLLRESEQSIDEDARREFGMRFMGISELKTLGGPYAGLFYNDDSIVLVYKGTSVLSFNEYLLDVTIQRVDASEYLYGEVHKGFYESLFPDPYPLNWYENMTYDKTNPFKTIMQTIFETAKIGKQKTGKPVNLWITGHSLGGALAALTMARLQMTMKDTDPLLREDPNRSAKGLPGRKTILQEMLARFSDDPDLLVLRDCYSVASPKVGDSTFAEEFGRNQALFCSESPYRSVYWRIVADKDVVPRLPPGCSVDPDEPGFHMTPCNVCLKSKSWLADEQDEDSKPSTVHKLTTLYSKYQKNPPKHLHTLLDYQHVGQLVEVFNAPKIPVVQPSTFEADLSHGVLRKKKEFYGFMSDLAEIATTSSTSITNGDANTGQDRDQAVRQIADDIAKARELYDIDEMSRLRQPGILESAALMVPSLLSHAPAAYQRNLVRGRFHFTSFPGEDFEGRVGKWLDESTEEAVGNGVSRREE
ncbi:hypothetical protein BGX21_010769 [Mortierella sp. AD011]|nr:hypothetical protein BGX20_000544 [Mortierella sp. AD010]KAF9393432.1 hypothetical protein BGX21_010769 [Mortierella sp. AD011]